MAQHDYDIANADGATVRADLNSLFDAVASNNSGASAPSTTFAHQWWFDETAGELNQRNAANTAWVKVAKKDGSGWTPYRQGALLGTAAVKDTGTSGDAVPLLNAAASFGSQFAWAGDISPAQLTTNQNDYNPTGLADAVTLRLSSDASRTLTGLQGGADGRVICIVNIGSNPIVLSNEDAGSSAANRFALGSSVTVGAGQGATLQYDATSSRWRAVAAPPSGQGTVLQSNKASTTTRTSTASNIPQDDTIPQNTEGAQWASVALTPASASNLIRVSGIVHLGGATALRVCTLFKDSGADAIAAFTGNSGANSALLTAPILHQFVAGGTSEITIAARFGAVSGTCWINGDDSSPRFGGVLESTLIVEEITP